MSSDHMTLAEAKAAIAAAQAWFSGLTITLAKQALWAEALAEVRGLRVADARSALKAIALREKPPGVFWSLEISEIIAVSRATMKRRVEREGQDLSRPAIAAKLMPHPDDARRAELARAVLRDLAARFDLKTALRAPREPRMHDRRSGGADGPERSPDATEPSGEASRQTEDKR